MDNLQPLIKISEIIAKEKYDKLLDQETLVLQNWLAESPDNKVIYNKLQNGEKLVIELNELGKFDPEKAFEKVEENISAKRLLFKVNRINPNYIKYAAAIAALVICSYLLILKIHKPETPHYVINIVQGSQKAILVTANNQKIVLDSTNNKQIIKNDLAEIVNSGSVLSYTKNDSINNSADIIAYNTLITPRGGEYTLVLSDGTTVKLNADSKLIYPVIFIGNTREVTLEGEAFFKVAKSDITPFIVKAYNINVKVYGTIFNVSAYSNESLVQTTLVEGSVGVSLKTRSDPEQKIKPDQQFTYNKATGISNTKEVNAGQFIAWTKRHVCIRKRTY